MYTLPEIFLFLLGLLALGVGATLARRAWKSRQERLRLEETLRQNELWFLAVLDNVLDGVITIDSHGIIKSFNNEAKKTFGYERTEVLGQNIKMLMSEPYKSSHDQYLANYAQTRNSSIIGIGREVEGRRKDASTFPMDLAVSELEAGGRKLFVGIVRDITQRKRAERELQQAKELAEASSLAKSQFLANMSHEIRTPMNSIMGMGDLLASTQLTRDQFKYVEIIQSAGQNLLDLINDILILSKIEATGIDLEIVEFDLNHSIKKTIDLVKFGAREKDLELGYRISPDVPSRLLGDSHRLRQIMINLLGNAIKFAKQGEIMFCVKKDPEEKDAGALLFSVSDTGIGIPSDKLESIFDGFSQADASTTRRYGGTGLGLTICKRLVEKMGGCIWVNSQVGKGSTFYFTVRFEVPAQSDVVVEKPQPEAEPFPAGPKALRLLLVEDSDDNRLLIQMYLKNTPHQVECAEDGKAAFDKFKSGGYDLILMDMLMPIMDGYTATREIRKWEQDRNLEKIPIIALTANALEGDERKCLNAGCSGYIAKPIRKEKLLEIINDFAKQIKPVPKQMRAS